MKISQIAVQLYTLREFCKSAEDLAKTAKKIRDIGYPAVQVSGVGPIDPAEIRKIMDGEGLAICATHEDPDLIRETPEKAIELVKTVGALHTAYPFPRGVDFSDPASVDAIISDLDRAGALFRENGITLSYHNHGIEFVDVGGMTFLEAVRQRTAPENLAFELDTYWVQYGGGNPVEWCERVKGRVPCLHLKDYGFDGKEGKPTYCEVGRGNLDFKAIIAAAEASGCEWYIVEQDTCPGDPFDSVKLSFDYIVENLVSG